MKNLLLMLIAGLLSSCTDVSSPSTDEVKLGLTPVDGKPLPFTVGKLGNAAAETVVISGTMSGNSIGPSCLITLAVSAGDPINTTISICTINHGDVIMLPIDLGSGTGTHIYQFQ